MPGHIDMGQDQVSVVLPDVLFLSGVSLARDRDALKEHGITHIVNATLSEENHFEADFKYHNVRVLDVRETDLRPHFRPTAAFMDEAIVSGGVVLVHCIAGISRSPSLVLAYQILYSGATLSDALHTTATARCMVSPNVAFMEQLLELEVDVRGSASIDMESYRAARKMKIKRTEDNMGELVANLKASQSEGSQVAVYAGHCMFVTRVMDDPRVAKIDEFSSDEEADYLVELAHQTGLKQSHVVGSKGASEGPKGRRSTSCRVERADPVVRGMVERAAMLVSMSPYNTEPIQIVHYGQGEHYNLHHDWFQPDNPGYGERVKDRGQRLVSIFVYLSDCEEGGCTHFPNIGQRFAPKKGTAVLWYNRDRNGQMDTRLLHAGEPVLKGEKYGLNIWFREHARKPSELS